MARSPHRRPITPGRRTSRNLVATGLTAGVLLIATLMLFHPDQTSPGDVTGTQAAQLVNSLPPPSPTPRPWNPQDAILSADGMQAAGYKVSRDRAVSKLSWHGWNRQFENNSALTPYYYVDVYVYRLPGGATPAKAIQDAGCDFTFTNGTISTTHVGAPANNRGAPADACLYVIPKAVDYVEYITADQYALVEVAIEARNANQDSAALSEAAGLAAQQLDTIDNLTR